MGMKSFIKVVSMLLVVVLLFVSCATAPGNISSRHVSSRMCVSYTCEQIKEEQQRVKATLTDICSKQQTYATLDAIGFAIGMFIFWPALFLMINGDHEFEIAQLKGECEAFDICKSKVCD